MNKLAISKLLTKCSTPCIHCDRLQLNEGDKVTSITMKSVAGLWLREEVSFLVAGVHVENMQGTSHDLFT